METHVYLRLQYGYLCVYKEDVLEVEHVLTNWFLYVPVEVYMKFSPIIFTGIQHPTVIIGHHRTQVRIHTIGNYLALGRTTVQILNSDHH